MTAIEAFRTLVLATLDSSKCSRFVELATSKTGQSKLLDALAHRFENFVKPSAIVAKLPAKYRQSPCFVFHYQLGCGILFPTFQVAYEELATHDSWLIVSADGLIGMHRPESRWDAERVFAG